MRLAQILVCETDGSLAESLRDPVHQHQWALREVRHVDACLGLVRQFQTRVLVVRVGRDVDRAFAVLEQVTRCHPETDVIVVGDAPNPAWAELAWDLGARYVLFPPQTRHGLVDIATHLMRPLVHTRVEET
jgi:DNA-binding NtrC family response regulator